MESRFAFLAVTSLLATAWAGCVGAPSEPPAPEAPTPAAVVVDVERPDTVFGNVNTGEAVGPDLNATLDAAPRLVAGEWWRIRFDSEFYSETSEVVRVVAAVEETGYLMGMPHDGWFKEAIAYHAPAFGDVAFDLSYATHNEIFEPLRFPLVAGATWETKFATQPLVATVERAEAHVAVIRFKVPPSTPEPTDPVYAALGLSGSADMVVTYDARQHEVVKFESVIGTWEVVEHGYGFEGWVTIPRGEHTAIDYGQFLPATPGGPVVAREIDVSGGFNRLTLMHVIVPVSTGAYRIKSTAPDGTVFTTESIAGSGATLRFYEARDPDGQWQVEDLVGGAGATYSMGIAYHQYDIRLPDGIRRADHSHPVVR